MPDINRVSLPEEFYDITSDLLLSQPEPQYLYAQMWLMAMATDLSPPSSLGMDGRSVTGVGAAYSDAERDRLTMSNELMGGIVTGRTDFRGKAGNMIRFNRPQFANTTYTEASRLITQNQSISTTAINVGSEQVSLTLRRFAGPYDQTNSNVAPFGMDSFDWEMGVHRVSSMVGTHLKRDFHRFVELVNVVLFDLAATVVRVTNMTTDATATDQDQFPLDYETISRAEQTADDADLPVFPDGYRHLVLHPRQLHELKGDPDYLQYAKENPQYNALFPSYVTSIGKLHIHKSTTLDTDTNASSIIIYKGHLISPGTMLAGMGRPPSVRSSTDDNYGESPKVIWLADMSFGLADDRFVLSVRST